MRPKRPQNPRRRRHSLLIQCEGQKTEPNYLDELCKVCGVRHRLEVKVKAGKGQSAAVTVNAAITEGQRRVQGEKVYDEVWCVLDVEHAGHEAKLNEAIALARKNNIRLFLSNPSFEVWLIAHFERTKRDFANGDATKGYLSQTYWQKHFGCDYDEGDERLYERLADRVGVALDNAQWVLETFHENASCRDSNASTEVYQLVRELLQV
ncbi:MAG: RloB domain-containing protein [Armatimonadetes bacterium]|nr:RloB domain-containing protein [Armatimonadota bacterium]